MASLIPNSESDIITAIRLYRSPRIGPSNYVSLLEQSESYQDAWQRLEIAYEERGFDRGDLCDMDTAKSEFDRGQKFGARLIFQGDETFPKLLKDTEVAPPFLWTKGDLSWLQKPQIAIVGARNASIEGVRIARHFARELSNAGIVVTSGLARGIDAAAHEGALATGTIGVIAGGLDIFYPRQNHALQENMFDRGLVVSEMPFAHQPQAKNFPQRNRIIAGLAQATLVIEATEHSGTVITANDATSFGRQLMAIPGHPFEPRSAGPNQLIKTGAMMVTSVEDVITYYDINFAPDPPTTIAPPNLGTITNFAKMGLEEIEGKVVRSFDDQRVSIE